MGGSSRNSTFSNLGVIAILAISLVLPPTLSGADDPCAGEESEADIRDCLALQIEQADRDLKRVRLMALASIEAAEMPADERARWKRAFEEAHASWERFRETDCQQVVSFEYWKGMGADKIAMKCILEVTRTRLDDLKRRYGIER